MHLVKGFSALMAKQKRNEEKSEKSETSFDNGEDELTAAGCLEAVRRILLSPLPELGYQQIEEQLYPVFDHIFNAEGADFIEEGLGLLNILLYNQTTISSRLWFYFPILAYILVGAN